MVEGAKAAAASDLARQLEVMRRRAEAAEAACKESGVREQRAVEG